MFDSLKAVASREKYFDGAKSEFTALQTKIGHDKKSDLLKHQDEVEKYLENEIVSRYYFLRGRIEQSLRGDKDYEKAVNILEQPAQYQAYLQPKK